MSFNAKRWLQVGLSAVFIPVALLFREFFFKTDIGLLLLVGGFIALFVLALLWNRCPHCGETLGRLSMFATHCPFCGKPFSKEE